MAACVPSKATENKPLIFSVSNQNKQILRPTKCPTKTCKECKINYVDKLGLDIFVVCKCSCHNTSRNLE